MKTTLRFLSLVSVLAATTVHAQTVSPIPAPTIINTAPYTINAPGYYQLGKDLTVSATSGNIITIAASNVTLDFAGHYISGPVNAGTQLRGVNASEQGNLTIKNGTVAYCYIGIFFGGNGSATSLNINQRVTDMLVTYCYAAGVEFSLSSNSDLLNSRLSFMGGSTTFASAYGLYNSGTGVKVSNNEITNVAPMSGSGTGYGLYNSASTFSIGNTIANCGTGIYSGKYQNNLTYNCTTPFSGGTDAPGNNGIAAEAAADPNATLGR